MIEQLDILINSPYCIIALASIIGLMVGSFLNVVIYRLPIMMQSNWEKECCEFLNINLFDITKKRKSINLALPLSHCPNCKTPIKPYQNIPLLSYFLLKGKCSKCYKPISLRYPFIELFTAIITVIVVWHFGYSPQTIFALILSWSLITLSCIDIEHQLLPDDITFPLLWLGIFLSLFGFFTDIHASIIGVMAGYTSLWLVYHLFKLTTGKEGMGYGDFKLFALLGGWFGWQYLTIIIIMSSLVGASIGLSLIIFAGRDYNSPIPFGPYLAASGWLTLLWGNDLSQLYFNLLSL
jgi:leader peptidase (prepilin peptidase)/N-methyltransferase